MNDQSTAQATVAPHDQYEDEARHFFSTWAEKLRELAAAKDEVVAVRQDLDRAKAAIEEKQIYNGQLERQLLESRAREARALEEIGVLKGILHAHGASIADVVSKIGVTDPRTAKPAPTDGERVGLASVAAALTLVPQGTDRA